MQQSPRPAASKDALNFPLHELPKRVHEVPDAEVWVHCAGGYRASVAASFLSAAGRRLVAIDDTFDNAKLTGLHVITDEAASNADGRKDRHPQATNPDRPHGRGGM